jgi:hypothetical protein
MRLSSLNTRARVIPRRKTPRDLTNTLVLTRITQSAPRKPTCFCEIPLPRLRDRDDSAIFVIPSGIENTPSGDADERTVRQKHDPEGVAKQASASGDRESNL